jgi:pimeloyl-ACP methyl ester carboxylesterase
MAETLFMIHGMCGGGWVWDNYRSYFESQGYNCVATTLRYHDPDSRENPPPQLGTTSLLDYLDDLIAEIAHLGVEPILIGHSLGGLLAQMLASRVPCKALVALASTPPAGILVLRPRLVKAFSSILFRWGWWHQPMRHTFQEAVYSMLHALPPQDQHPTYDQFVYESGRAGFEAGFWFLDSKRAAHVDASRVTCPVLVLAGAHDRCASVHAVRRIAQRYEPHSTFHLLPKHAHWMVAEPGWQEVTGWISDWLAQVLE